MGNFFGSTQIRTDSMEKVKEVLKTLCQKEEFECYLSPSINGWVGVYNNMNGQVPLAETLAEHFEEDIISLLVHDDDFFCYWYYKGGKLVDQYNSCPDYFGQSSAEEMGGNPEVFRQIVGNKKKIKRLNEILAVVTEERSVSYGPKNVESENISEIRKKNIMLNKALQRVKDNPRLLVDIASEINVPFEERIKELKESLDDKEDTSIQILMQILGNPTLYKEVISPIFEALIERESNELKYSEAVNNTNESPKRMHSKYTFAGEQLRDFAEVLNIKNTQTCYEYLQQGETDDIVNWKQFIKLPE